MVSVMASLRSVKKRNRLAVSLGWGRDDCGFFSTFFIGYSLVAQRE
jgi:hypothetical protein